MQWIYVRLEVQLVEIACFKEAHTFNYFLPPPICNKLNINDVLHRETFLLGIPYAYFWLYSKGNTSRN